MFAIVKTNTNISNYNYIECYADPQNRCLPFDARHQVCGKKVTEIHIQLQFLSSNCLQLVQEIRSGNAKRMNGRNVVMTSDVFPQLFSTRSGWALWTVLCFPVFKTDFRE